MSQSRLLEAAKGSPWQWPEGTIYNCRFDAVRISWIFHTSITVVHVMMYVQVDLSPRLAKSSGTRFTRCIEAKSKSTSMQAPKPRGIVTSGSTCLRLVKSQNVTTQEIVTRSCWKHLTTLRLKRDQGCNLRQPGPPNKTGDLISLVHVRNSWKPPELHFYSWWWQACAMQSFLIFQDLVAVVFPPLISYVRCDVTRKTSGFW